MTIILAVARSEFVVLAADQMWSGASSVGGRWVSGLHTKLATHPREPFAVATAGFARIFPREGFVIDEIAETLTAMTSPSVAAIHTALTERFESRVRRQRAILRRMRGLDDQMAVLDVAVAGASGELGWLRIADDASWTFPEVARVSPADRLRPFLQGAYASERALYASGVVDARSVAEHARQVVAHCIAVEPSLTGLTENMWIGGEPEVVLVDRDGARRVAPYDR